MWSLGNARGSSALCVGVHCALCYTYSGTRHGGAIIIWVTEQFLALSVAIANLFCADLYVFWEDASAFLYSTSDICGGSVCNS